MKINFNLLKKDLRVSFPVVLVIAVYICGCNLIFGKICTIRMLTGIPCPGCGMTRAFLLVSQGKIYEATMMHPFWIPIIILAVIFPVLRYGFSDSVIVGKITKLLKTLIAVTILLFIIFYIYRMIVYFPDIEPMKYDSHNIMNMLHEKILNMICMFT